jgi:DNA-binding transcriptional regulator YiaG
VDNFCVILKEARVRNGLSQEELAHQLGVSLSTVQRWERNLCVPSKLAQGKLNRLFEQMGIQQRFGGFSLL